MDRVRLNLPLFSAVLVISIAPFCSAGSLFPCPKAVTSAHGSAVTIAEDTVDWEKDETGKAIAGRLLKTRFTVMSKLTFVNDYQKVSAHVTYWGDLPWAVELDMSDLSDRGFTVSCAVPLVTDDGRFLALLATGPAFDGVVRVYSRRDDDHRMQDGTVKGVLIKTIQLKELWPPNEINAVKIWDDHTPDWFAGGTFEFNPENSELIHATRWGNTDYITLRDGTVRNVPCSVPCLASQ